MRLKYYLRGLGLGIIFAVIIMMIGFHDNKQSMSDTEIIEKAKTLGMVEAKNISGTVADEYNSEKTDSSATNSDASSQKAETEQDSQMQDSQTAQEDTQQEAAQPAADAKQETVEPQNAVTTYTISVTSQDTCRTIAEKLKALNLVDDAEQFRIYMGQKGADHFIADGEHIIPQVHFGHQTRRWNPKMAPYIYTERNGIYIIDLQKSVGKVDEAYDAVSDIAAQGGTILFVGTKKQAQDAIKTEAERCGMYYVNERWLGGMLTNFRTIESRIARLKAIETMSEDGTFDVLPKKEVIALKKEWEKLEKNLGGIKDMKRIPDAIFVVDPKKERICIKEAQALGITLIGIADTNCDPDELDYVIPGNDDAIRAVKLIVSKMADAVIEAKQGAEEEVTAEEASDETVEE